MSGCKEYSSSSYSTNEEFNPLNEALSKIGQDTPSKGEFFASAPCKPLPPPLPCTSSDKLADWEHEIREYANGEFGNSTLGANASSSIDATCRKLCTHWGYRLPQSHDAPTASFVSQVWRLVPPTKGHVKAISEHVLQDLIAVSLNSSLVKGTTLGKEMWYADHAWPEGSDQTDGEIKILETLAPKLANRVKNFPILAIFELGAGDSTKMTPFLDLLEPLPIKCRYYGVDVNKKAVDEKVMKFNEKYTNVECSGVHGTFEDGIAMAATQAGKKVITSLGSTVTNFDPTQALENLRKLCRGDNLVILGQQGPDAVTGRHGDKVHRDAYHTERFEKFIWQGMLGTGNEVLRKKVFTEREWEIKCEIRHRPWRHQFVFHYKGEERFRGFVSFKYHEHEIISMIKETGAPSPEIYRHRETAMSKAFKTTHLQDINKWQGFTPWIAWETKRIWMGYGGALNLL